MKREQMCRNKKTKQTSIYRLVPSEALGDERQRESSGSKQVDGLGSVASVITYQSFSTPE